MAVGMIGVYIASVNIEFYIVCLIIIINIIEPSKARLQISSQNILYTLPDYTPIVDLLIERLKGLDEKKDVVLLFRAGIFSPLFIAGSCQTRRASLWRVNATSGNASAASVR